MPGKLDEAQGVRRHRRLGIKPLGLTIEHDSRLAERIHLLDQIGQRPTLDIGEIHVAMEQAREIGRVMLGDQIGEFRSEEHTSELQSLMRISYAVFCLKKKTTT